MLFHVGHLIAALFGFFFSPTIVAARFCEGGHICSLPRECCTQGCCPPYQSGPRQLPPASDHVLNLFFISHWYFWCVVVAIILAVLCAYALWKKRRTLCGWGFTEHHAQSEGDSAGSCYAPPQYSRCNSFHHPPPPYTEVTSKPDLYPLVFTCNSDNGKNGASYLMVQYFRNYIVRPAGSLSATSTVDSLSSSFICNANEANTLVPPPYSRAASPEIGITSHFQQHYMIPRSASQVVCSSENTIMQQQFQRNSNAFIGNSSNTNNNNNNNNNSNNNQDQPSHESSSSTSGGADSGNSIICLNPCNSRSVSVCGNNEQTTNTAAFISSQSDQQFRYNTNSSSSLSDIFVNNSCTAGIGGATTMACASTITTDTTPPPQPSPSGDVQNAQTTDKRNSCGYPGITNISNSTKTNHHPLHRASTNPNQFIDTNSISNHPLYNSCNSIGGISITVPLATDSETEYRDLDMLRRSLETCCQILQQQQQMQSPQIMSSELSSENDCGGGDSGSGAAGVPGVSGGSGSIVVDLNKKYDDTLRSYVTSATCSAVSSLANIGTPASPPQATSPTGEVKDILDQIRQLQLGTSFDENILRQQQNKKLSNPTLRPAIHLQLPIPVDTNRKGNLQRFPTIPDANNGTSPLSLGNMSAMSAFVQSAMTPVSVTTSSSSSLMTKRPSTLQQGKKKLFSKPSKAMYLPMMSQSGCGAIQSPRCSMIKSPINGANFLARGRGRKGWISRSAPTTPGTGLPPNRLGDDSPLLNEHDEDQESELNA